MNGINARMKNDGIAYTISEKSISFTDCIISTPTMISAAAVAEPGTSATSGDRKIASRKQMPVVTEVSPVRPPCAIPAELSTNAVTVLVPSTAPPLTPIASTNMALPIRFLPSTGFFI
ncbi:hypothetical protein D3C78_1622840 [compost metagenome]